MTRSIDPSKGVDEELPLRYPSAEPAEEVAMARSRKKKEPTQAAPTPTPLSPESAPPASPPPIRIWAADAGDDGLLVLYQDPARGVLMIAPAEIDQPLRLSAAAGEFLRENEFAATSPDGPWTRTINPVSALTDRIDAERLLLKAAELHRGSRGRSSGRGR